MRPEAAGAVEMKPKAPVIETASRKDNCESFKDRIIGMRQGGPSARRPRGRHSNGGGNNGGEGARPPSGGPMRGGDNRPRSASALRHQTFDSNGPDVRVRGNAWQVYEKYQSLARDATSSGDRVMAENYLQHAEHYYRIIEAIEEATAAEQRHRGGGPTAPFTGQQPEVPSNYYAPDGQLMAAQPSSPAPAQAAPSGQPSATMPPLSEGSSSGQAEVQRKTPAPAPSAFFAPDEAEDQDSGPQTLVAQR